ncbi:receptor-like protein eix2, partial [Quercus suber]
DAWTVNKQLFSRSEKALRLLQTPSFCERPRKIVANGEELELMYQRCELSRVVAAFTNKSTSHQHITIKDLFNILQGEISPSLLDLPYLKFLDLSLNDFHQDSIPEFIGSLQYIEYLKLSNANFRGTSPTHLGNLSHLEVLDLSGNCFSLKADNLNWAYDLSSLKVLDLGGVDLSNAEDWLDAVNMLPTLVELSLFFCKLHKPSKFDSCQLQGLIPDAIGNLNSFTSLDLSMNNFEGLFQKKSLQLSISSSLRELYLSNNRLIGSLEQSIAQLSQLVVLNMAGNHLEDLSSNWFVLKVSTSWIPLFQLETIDVVPDWFWNLSSRAKNMNFSFNNLHGYVPNLSPQLQLSLLDLIPYWLLCQLEGIGSGCKFIFWNNFTLMCSIKYGQNLVILNLANNSLYGQIPSSIGQLIHLRTLRLDRNRHAGELPLSLQNSTASVDNHSFTYIPHKIYYHYIFQNFLPFAKSLDLSSNKSTGQIPKEVMSLVGLKNLNLSTNHLIGPIPPNIAEMIELESLDLSRNQLSCTIPTGMTNLTSVAILDMSHNNLSGVIPRGLLLDRFDNSSYIGNLQLCGIPLSKICSNNESFGDPQCSRGDEENQDGSAITSLYTSLGLGFITGFWVFRGSLLLNRSWRYTYFRFLGNMNDKIYVMVAVGVTRLKRKFQRGQAPQVKGGQ